MGCQVGKKKAGRLHLLEGEGDQDRCRTDRPFFSHAARRLLYSKSEHGPWTQTAFSPSWHYYKPKRLWINCHENVWKVVNFNYFPNI